MSKITDKIYCILYDKGWTNVTKDDSLKIDYVLKHNNNKVAGLKVSTSKSITKRSIALFKRRYQNCGIPLMMLTNGNDLLVLKTTSLDCEIKKIEDLSKASSLIENYYKNLPKNYNYIYYIVGILLSVLLVGFLYTKYEMFKQTSLLEDKTKDVEHQAILKEQYATCLESNLDVSNNAKVKEYEEVLNNYFKKNYSASIAFQDIYTGYTYSYNANKSYYAASLAKTIDALYIYENAIAGNIDLNTTITYHKINRYKDSPCMKKHKIGDKVTLRELTTCAIKYSDNSAHIMLVDYIGLNKIKNYMNELGVEYSLSKSDYFGSIETSAALKYMARVYNFISKDNELAKELKKAFVDSNDNYLKLSSIKIEAATKYGYYGSYFHNIGILLDDHPYIAVVLTTEGAKNINKKISDISGRLYRLHTIYEDAKKDECYRRVYD